MAALRRCHHVESYFRLVNDENLKELLPAMAAGSKKLSPSSIFITPLGSKVLGVLFVPLKPPQLQAALSFFEPR